MQTTQRKSTSPSQSAFTLIEMMVVVAIIGILIAGVFKLLSATGEKTKQAITVKRMERLHNALSGYYAEYGSYPPVMQFESPDPEKQRDGGNLSSVNSCTFTAESSNRAAHSQSIAYEYPPTESLDDYFDEKFAKNLGARSAGLVLGGQDVRANTAWESWYALPLFRMGVLSYVLPRAHLAYGTANEKPYLKLFRSSLWTSKLISDNDEKAITELIKSQMALEERTVARWLPNLEHCINGATGSDTSMGVDLSQDDDYNPGINASQVYSSAGGKFILRKLTMNDGWNNEFYYYSAPPYQSYRIWSSGKDGKTFPPWIPLDAKPIYKQAAAWVEDDIVRFDH